jgi:hypothetical protein
MKGFMTITLLLLSSLSSAMFNWDLVSNDSNYANTPKEIKLLLQEYPEVLANSTFEAKDLEFVNVTEAIYEYAAETTCEENDERLTHISLTYFACPFNKPTQCITKFGEILSDKDPCLANE